MVKTREMVACFWNEGGFRAEPATKSGRERGCCASSTYQGKGGIRETGGREGQRDCIERFDVWGELGGLSSPSRLPIIPGVGSHFRGLSDPPNAGTPADGPPYWSLSEWMASQWSPPDDGGRPYWPRSKNGRPLSSPVT